MALIRAVRYYEAKYVKRYFNDPLIKNSYFLMAASIAVSGFGFIFWLIVTRLYTSYEIGIAAGIISASGILTLISTFGFNIGIIRFLPNETDKQGMINSLFFLTLVLSLFFSTIFISSINFLYPGLLFVNQTFILSLLFITIVISFSLSQLQNGIFIALRSAEFALIQGLIGAVLKLIFIVLVASMGVLGILSAWGLSTFISVILCNFFLISLRINSYSLLPIIKKKLVQDVFHFSFDNYIIELLISSPPLILPLIVLNVLTPTETAYFYMDWALTSILLTISASINNSLFAESSYAPTDLKKNTIKSIKLTMALLCAIILLIFLFGDKILLLFGKEYSENGYTTLRILVLSSIPCIFIDMSKTISKIHMRLEPIVYLNALIAFLEISLCYFMAYEIGLIGIGLGYLLAQSIGASFGIWLIMNEFEEGIHWSSVK